MNGLARNMVVSFSLIGSTTPAFASELVSNPGDVAKLVSMTSAELAANHIEQIALGDVVLTSGHIVATDPLADLEREPFLVTVAPGKYPVTLFTAEGRMAAATMRFAEGDPIRWQLAVVDGQDLKTLKAGDFFGYGVDTGLGSFMDKDTAGLIAERDAKVEAEKGDKYISYYDDVLDDDLAVNSGDYVLHQPIADKPGNAAVFSTGWGDGVYPVYWGLNADGVPIVMLTEFNVIETLKGTGK